MALTINPPSPAASDGSTNSASTAPPQTPVLQGLPLATPVSAQPANANDQTPTNGPTNGAGGVKRTTKPSRRANTAERRATHNAVERQRRETLNGRFLDLAALLPNLSQIRRPSKSAIVNSSIAHINASRRHRLLAAQQLRLLKGEADALRHEVNEWRARAGVPAVEEPRRADGFAVVLSGELEFDAADVMEGDEGEEDEEFAGAAGYAPVSYSAPAYTEEPEEYHHGHHPHAAAPFAHPHHPELALQQAQAHPQRMSHSPPHYAHSPAAQGSPIIASPTTPAFAYDTHARQLAQHQMMLQHHQQAQNDKWAYEQQVQHQQMRQSQGAW